MDKKKKVIPVDELNLIVMDTYRTTDKEDREKEFLDEFLTLLILAYLEGNGEDNEVDIVKLNQSIYKEVAGENFTDRVKTHVENEDVESLQRLLVTEWHRNFNQGAYDGAVASSKTMKTWVTMRDERVRDTHEFLEGVTIPINEEFHTSDGDHARFPNDFENPANNINCRCILEYT